MNQPNIQLRPERESDLSFLMALYTSTRIDVALSGLPDNKKQEFIEMQFHAQRYSYRTNYVNPEFLIIEKDGQPAGRLYRSRSPSETRVIDITIAPQYRGQGIGSCLIRAIQYEAKIDGVPVTLHAEKMGDMSNYYKKFGFEVVEEKEMHYFMKWSAGSSIFVPE